VGDDPRLSACRDFACLIPVLRTAEITTAVNTKIAVVWIVEHVNWYKFTNVSEVLTASIFRATSEELWGVIALIALMIQTVRTSGTLVNLYQSTWQSNNPGDSHLHTCICVYRNSFFSLYCCRSLPYKCIFICE
jgi:hypothetical protein